MCTRVCRRPRSIRGPGCSCSTGSELPAVLGKTGPGLYCKRDAFRAIVCPHPQPVPRAHLLLHGCGSGGAGQGQARAALRGQGRAAQRCATDRGLGGQRGCAARRCRASSRSTSSAARGLAPLPAGWQRCRGGAGLAGPVPVSPVSPARRAREGGWQGRCGAGRDRDSGRR